MRTQTINVVFYILSHEFLVKKGNQSISSAKVKNLLMGVLKSAPRKQRQWLKTWMRHLVIFPNIPAQAHSKNETKNLKFQKQKI